MAATPEISGDGGRMTLLDMVQRILSALGEDEVNSIGDSVDALDIAKEVENSYYYILQTTEQELQRRPFQLIPFSDPDRPTHFKVPPYVQEIEWIKYNDTENNRNNWLDVCYLEPEDFIRRSFNRSNNNSVKEVSDPSGAIVYVATNQQPKYFTSFDEETLIFDGYNSSTDTTLKEQKTMGWGLTMPPFEQTDGFIPRLRADLFPYLLSEAKNACFVNFKGVSNSNEEIRARRLKVSYQNKRHLLKVRQPSSRSPNDYSRPRPT